MRSIPLPFGYVRIIDFIGDLSAVLTIIFGGLTVLAIFG